MKDGLEISGVSRRQLIRAARRPAWLNIGVLSLVIGYLVYAWFALDINRVIERANAERFATLSLDMIAHKVHIVRSNRTGDVVISVEGERTATYDDPPDWVGVDGDAYEIDLGDGYSARLEGPTVIFRLPDYGDVFVEYDGENVRTVLPAGLAPPEWMRVTEAKFDARPTLFRRVQVSRAKIEVHRYFYGWENFFFAFNSDLAGYSFSDVMGLVFSEERLHPEVSNTQHVLNSFWNNPDWQHRQVVVAVYETLLMAVLGTLTAVLVGMPLAFIAANNFTPSRVLRFFTRRLFDFLRGIDNLIWSLIFIRAFGLGPLTGALAIAFTDTGSLGKLFSEALENIDKKQVEGVKSTGANRLQIYRFGVIPQIMPIFLSQALYYLESNTRSATVIGALGAGGIGLLLAEYIKTKRDWENVAYVIILTIVLVIFIDNLSGWLRRKLIGRRET